LKRHNLKLAAVGTGGGWVTQRLTLTSDDRAVRDRARDFVRSIIDVAGELGAPAVVGSMQGKWGETVSRASARSYLAEALHELAGHARQYKVPLVFEPLNRYETNMVNTVEAGMVMISTAANENIRLLADLFHMNIEEADIAGSIRGAKEYVGHVHWSDSNRRPAGAGHTDFAPVAAALREIGYAGFISAEALPYPDEDAAARLMIESFRRHFPRT
jgi:sugar phosphate isomerase/epimerase